MLERQAFQPNGELDVTASDHVLDLEVLELDVEADLLDHACVFPCRGAAFLLIFGARHHHFPRAKHQRRRFRVADAQNHRSKALGTPAEMRERAGAAPSVSKRSHPRR